MTLRKTEEQEVRELLALRPTDDLTDDERRRVDEALLYSEECRKELADYERCLAVLQTAAAEPSPTDGRPTLWKQIEPRLGPAARRFAPRRVIAAIPTYWLTAAVFLLAAGNLYLLTVGQSGVGPERQVAVKPAGSIASDSGPGNAMLVNNRYPVLVDPRDERGRVRPLLGLIVVPCEGRDGGVEISAIFDGTSAEDAGLQVGDILLEVDGKRIQDPGCVIGCLKKNGVGQRIELVYLREGQKHRVNVFLGGSIRVGDREFYIRNLPIPRELLEQR